MKKIFLLIACIASVNAFCQIDDGSIAPDFTLTDWYGEEHHLYSYLNEGKTVFVEIFAAHCSGCWAYHQSHRLKNLYNSYGPEGTDEIMVLALEHDEYNGEDEFIGIGEYWQTQGNWLEGTPYPQFNVEGGDRNVFIDYNVTFYPVIYKICPDKTVERIYTNETEEELYEKVQGCSALSIDEVKENLSVYYNSNSRQVIVNDSPEISSVSILNIQGQILKTISPFTSSTIDMNEFKNGVFLFDFKTELGTFIEKLNIY